MAFLRKYGEWLALGSLLLFSLGLRLWQSGITPPGLHFDEAAYGLIANSIRRGNFGVFYSEFTGREPIFMYAVALSQLIFGQTVFAERLPAALNGVAVVAASFWCFREFQLAATGKQDTGDLKQKAFLRANPRLWAWLAALMVAACFWNLLLSREGYRANTPALFAALAFAACWRAVRLQTLKWAVIAGVLSGLTLYTYLSARFIPFVFVSFLLYFGLFYWLFWRKRPGFGPITKRHWQLLAVWVGAAVATVTPLAIHFALHRNDFFQRTAQISIFSPDNGGPVAKFTTNLLDAIKMISIAGTRDMKYNLTGRPVFDTLAAVFFYIGLVSCIWRATKKPVYGFLLIWLFVMFLPTILSEAGNNPLRSFGAMPAVMGIWALGIMGVWEGLSRLWGRWGWRTGLAVATLSLLITFGITYNDYFNVWAKSDELYTAFETDYTDLATYLKDQPTTNPTVIAAELPAYPSIIYLAPNTEKYDWANISQAVIVPKGAISLDYIVPNRAWASGELQKDWYKPLGVNPAIQNITNPAGRELGQAYHFNLPANFADRLQITRPACASVINFNDEITLLGYRLNNQPQKGQPLSLTLYWQAKKPAKDNYQIFVHLLDKPDSDHKWGQQDANGAYSQNWQKDDLIIGQYNFTVNAQTPPGDNYWLSIGLYDTDKRQEPRVPILTTDCSQVNAAKNAFLIPNIQVK